MLNIYTGRSKRAYRPIKEALGSMSDQNEAQEYELTVHKSGEVLVMWWNNEVLDLIRQLVLTNGRVNPGSIEVSEWCG